MTAATARPTLHRTACLMLAAVATLAFWLPGCGGYELRGRVISGEASYISIVDEDHPMMVEGRGVGGVALHLQEDPGTLRAESIARTTSDPDGVFTIPVDRIGAGALEYNVGLSARKQGYEPAELPFRLPGRNKAVLVVLRSGQDRALDEGFQSMLDETMRAW